MSRAAVSGEFIAGPRGPVFVLARAPLGMPRSCVLVVPPFAEEMNKCRRMVTEVGLGLAGQGVATVVPDLYGTGDSAGDFADATWEAWQGDIKRTMEWSAERGCPVSGILAIRLGCALAAAVQSSGDATPLMRSVLWQPVFDGGRYLSQFLRLRLAANMVGGEKESLAELRAKLISGSVLQVAGYGLSGRLASELDAVVTPARLPRSLGDVVWMEIVRDSGSALPEPSMCLVRNTSREDGQVQVQGHVGEPFWMSTEIVVHREIVTETINFLAGSPRRAAGT